MRIRSASVLVACLCPGAGVECVIVRTLPPPSESARAAAIRRSEELAAQRSASGELAEQQAKESESYREERRRRETALAGCEQWFAEREILQLTLPVYQDAQQQLHYRDSLHHHWYEGERSYLADAERALRLAEVRRQIATVCGGVEPLRSNYTQRFRFPPPLNEVPELLDEMLLPGGAPTSEVCPFARHVLQEQRDMRSGSPANDERRLQRLVDERCR